MYLDVTISTNLKWWFCIFQAVWYWGSYGQCIVSVLLYFFFPVFLPDLTKKSLNIVYRGLCYQLCLLHPSRLNITTLCLTKISAGLSLAVVVEIEWTIILHSLHHAFIQALVFASSVRWFHVNKGNVHHKEMSKYSICNPNNEQLPLFLH